MTTATATVASPVTDKSTDDEIDAFHSRIRAKLLAEEAALISEARDMQHEAARMMADAHRLRREANASRWFNLSGSLTEDEIESLCNVDPIELLNGDE